MRNAGVIPDTEKNWQTTTEPTGSRTYSFWWWDSNNWDFNNGYSRVVMSLTQSWEVSFDKRNNMAVTITTRINSIVRDSMNGSFTPNPGRDIQLYRAVGQPLLFRVIDQPINNNHPISGPIELGTQTFTIAPEQGNEVHSIYVHNQTIGYDIYDDIGLGISFKNILPADYRPGERKVGGSWKSLDRDGGVCDRIGYGEMRTVHGGVDTNDPPTRKQSNLWYNQRKIGEEK